MSIFHRFRISTHSGRAGQEQEPSEPRMLANGWDTYAREWSASRCHVLPGSTVQHLGDEWTAEDAGAGAIAYGLAPSVIADFAAYLKQHLLDPYLPAPASEGLEIGPGGGRLTTMLLPRTRTLHVADASQTMLQHLRRRFAEYSNLVYHHTDGMTLPALPPSSLDYAIAFDVFVHFEPRLTYWYLRQVAPLLRPGGTGIVHYSNVLTPIGWRQFESDLEANVRHRSSFAAFGVMCPQLMARFFEMLKLEVISLDVGVIPRDAVAVFRRPQSG